MQKILMYLLKLSILFMPGTSKDIHQCHTEVTNRQEVTILLIKLLKLKRYTEREKVTVCVSFFFFLLGIFNLPKFLTGRNINVF